MCKREVEKYLWLLQYVLDQYDTQEMCEKAFLVDPVALTYVPDWLATAKMLEDLDNDAGGFFRWSNGYKQCKA